MLLLLAACNEYVFVPDDKTDGTDTDTGFGVDTGETTLNPDVCPDLESLPDGAAIDESCTTEPMGGPLEVQVEWMVTGFGEPAENVQVLTTPLVGQLDDDDGDGDIDKDDTPDVVVVADDDGAVEDSYGLLAVLSGDDGTVTTTIYETTSGEYTLHPYRYATPALGDLDADGVPEIITVVRVIGETVVDTGGETGAPEETADTDVPVGPPPPDDKKCQVASFAADGTVNWLSDEPVSCAGHMVAVADLDGDGLGEVMAGDSVFDSTGVRLWRSPARATFAAYSEIGSQPLAMDLDDDGDLEVLWGRIVHDKDGNTLCTISGDDDDGFPAVADLDDDGLGEFVLVGNGKVSIYQDDCLEGDSWVLAGSGNGGPATIADFDADGEPEIGVADALTYSVYERDGTVLWSNAITDASSHSTGSSVFDFDGDGQSEALYGDETTLWIFDGATGDVRLADTSHTSRTLHELPVAADVDGDGHMEIVVPNGGGHYDAIQTGLYVLGSAGTPWLGDRQVWNQHAYSITNINDDLSLPAPAAPNWPFYNTFRSGTLGETAGGALPDALGYMQICTDPCDDGEIGIEVRLANGGMSALRAGVSITVYAVDGSSETPLGSFTSTDVLASGGASEVWTLSVPESAIPEGVLLLRADDKNGDELVVECREDNNEVRVEGAVCPADTAG